jgi:hypothetical protein
MRRARHSGSCARNVEAGAGRQAAGFDGHGTSRSGEKSAGRLRAATLANFPICLRPSELLGSLAHQRFRGSSPSAALSL